MVLPPTHEDTRSLFPAAVSTGSLLTAQQTTLVRSVLGSPSHIRQASFRDPLTGRKAVQPLSRDELDGFATAWGEAPIGCIRGMNRAIGLVDEPRRLSRYIEAAFDLELLMDRRAREAGASDLVGVPAYLADGYTDLGIQTSSNRPPGRPKILVDKERLRSDLVCTKKRAIEELRKWEERSVELESVLRGIAESLRESVGFDESASSGGRSETTVRLSESIAERHVSSRHLAILLQLRLQEAGLSSRLVKGKLHLYSLKLKHAWNVVSEENIVALVDAAFSEDDVPFVLVGGELNEVYARAAELRRVYGPSPDSFHRYQIRGA